MKVRIMCDSTADVTPDVKARLKIIPLTVNFDGREYIDGVTMTHTDFYRMLETCEKLPTTSQPTPAAFHEAFSEAVEAGEDVVLITISEHISGTYQSANIAAADFPGRVHVIDSKTLCIGCGILVEYALQLADSGMSAADIAAKLTVERERLHLIAIFDTMKNLIKGGRISKAKGIAGELLGIKPIIGTMDGKITIFNKARGRKTANSMLTKEIESRGGVDFNMPMLLGFTGVDDHILRGYLEGNSHLFGGQISDLRSTLVGSVVGTHAGPGAIAVAFFGA